MFIAEPIDEMRETLVSLVTTDNGQLVLAALFAAFCVGYKLGARTRRHENPRNAEAPRCMVIDERPQRRARYRANEYGELDD